MTISELHSSEDLRRHEFPVARKQIFLGHAWVSPLPRRVKEAMDRCLAAGAEGDQAQAFGPGLISETRALAARLLKARPEEIALVGPTSLALSFVAGGLRFRKHQHVLVYQDDYPSNVYPWMTLADRGVEVRFLNVARPGQIRVRDVVSQIDEQTRCVALSSCHFLSGYRAEIAEIGAEMKKRNILFCVDGIQTLGAFPTTVENVDFLAAGAQKWLLGPCGAGILYVSEAAQEILAPTTQGWHNIRCPDFAAQDELVYRKDARKYEAGTANLIGLAGLRAALELALEVGVDAIAADLLRKRAWLVPALREKGFEVAHADADAAHAGGIITFSREGTDLAAIHQTLLDGGVAASLRTDRGGQKFLRISPHYYNTDEELRDFLSRLP